MSQNLVFTQSMLRYQNLKSRSLLSFGMSDFVKFVSYSKLDKKLVEGTIKDFKIKTKILFQLRPYLLQFLKFASSLFEVVVFTASPTVYANRFLYLCGQIKILLSRVLDRLDPHHELIDHRMFRHHCHHHHHHKVHHHHHNHHHKVLRFFRKSTGNVST